MHLRSHVVMQKLCIHVSSVSSLPLLFIHMPCPWLTKKPSLRDHKQTRQQCNINKKRSLVFLTTLPLALTNLRLILVCWQHFL